MYYNTKTGERSENHPLDDYFRSLYLKLRTTPPPVESFSMRNVSRAENAKESHPLNEQHRDSLTHSLSFLRSYDRREAESLQSEIQKLTVEITLFNEWMNECVVAMKEQIKRIEFLKKRMEDSFNSSFSIAGIS